MMNLDNYYIHATGGCWGEFNDHCNLLKILVDGKIRSTGITNNYKTSSKYKNHTYLCDPQKSKTPVGNHICSFDEFVLYSPSLVFSRDLPVKYIGPSKNSNDEYDEVLYDGDLSLDKLQFITFPLWPKKYDDIMMTDEDKIKNLELFRDHLVILAHEFKTIKTKDIFTGKDITPKEVNAQIKIYQKGI